MSTAPEIYFIIWGFDKELKLLEPYNAQVYLSGAKPNHPIPYVISRALVEGTIDGCYGFTSEETLTRVQVQTNSGLHEGIKDE